MNHERDQHWPELPLKEWQETYSTLHLWTQIVGKILLKQNSLINHWWEVALYVSPRGLSTTAIPYNDRTFDIAFDFINHVLLIRTAEGNARVMSLAPRSVAEFYGELMNLLHSLKLDMKVDKMPKEIPNPIPFDEDHVHASYDREYANRFWRILLQVDRLMRKFRSPFIGKCSPVHFFWGSFDLAVSRFSGRRAPPRPGGDHITQEGYSHEVSSCGWWPGGGNIQGPAFYAYTAPEPPGFSTASPKPSQAFYNPPTKGYVLSYDDVRKSANPDAMVLEFFQWTYALGADLAGWPRSELERDTRDKVRAA